ncbi:MAG TPA: glycosyltransferase family 2 protein [Chitinophagaceae bacterium]|nr:glycosyltransferase family 2 protein [Chitinophagaceae bacterium]
MWHIRISVIIPTYNRANYIGHTIDSFLNQKTDHPFEILVADNNSSDNTEEIVRQKQFSSHRVPVIYLKEPKQGVHFARNTAAKKSTGELLYFTDDDMIADENLLTEIARIFEKDNTVGAATGKVLPRWEKQPPEWILKYCNNGWLSLADYGDTDFVAENDPGIWSCHQAIKRNVFLKAGGFNPENTGGIWIGDGETGLNIKIHNLGYKFAYQPKAVTYHIIPKHRTTQDYLNKRLKNQGNCDSYTEYRLKKNDSMELFRSSILDLIRVPKFSLKGFLQKINGKDSWHMTRAYASYYGSRSRYALRLIYDRAFRDMVLKNDWLNE